MVSLEHCNFLIRPSQDDEPKNKNITPARSQLWNSQNYLKSNIKKPSKTLESKIFILRYVFVRIWGVTRYAAVVLRTTTEVVKRRALERWEVGDYVSEVINLVDRRDQYNSQFVSVLINA